MDSRAEALKNRIERDANWSGCDAALRQAISLCRSREDLLTTMRQAAGPGSESLVQRWQGAIEALPEPQDTETCPTCGGLVLHEECEDPPWDEEAFQEDLRSIRKR